MLIPTRKLLLRAFLRPANVRIQVCTALTLSLIHIYAIAKIMDTTFNPDKTYMLHFFGMDISTVALISGVVIAICVALVIFGKANYFNPEHAVAQTLTRTCREILKNEEEPFVMSGGTYARKLPNAFAFGTGMKLPSFFFAMVCPLY